MKNKFLYLLSALLLIGSAAYAKRTVQEGQIRYGEPSVSRQSDELVVRVPVDFSQLDLNRQEMVTLTPVLRAKDRTHRFAPLVITGRTRAKALHRQVGFGNYHFERQPEAILKNRNNDPTQYTMVMRTPYQEWMRDAELVCSEQVSGCGNCRSGISESLVAQRILPPLFVPDYRIAYIVPPVEPVKARSETHTARMNFVVNRYELRRDFKDNAAILDEVDRIFNEINNDKDLTLTELSVTGFASPEGNFNSNMTLSKNRALAFVDYLEKHHSIPKDKIKVDWKGEDWAGLRAAVDKSSLLGRAVILDIIDNTPNIAERKRRMEALPSYRSVLLPQFYAPLRRNEYTVAYVARPFNVEEAREIIRTKPQLLSLNEMFLVANTYPKGSREFKEVFDIATRLFPNDPIAIANSAALDIEQGALDAGIARLRQLDMPEAANNMGVAFIKQGEYDRAKEAFQRASRAGNAVAAENLKQMTQWQESQF